MTLPGQKNTTVEIGWLRMNLGWMLWIACTFIISAFLGLQWASWLHVSFHVGPLPCLAFAFVTMIVLFLLLAFWVGPAGFWSYQAIQMAIVGIRAGKYDDARRRMAKVRNPWASVPEVRSLKVQLVDNPTEALTLAENCSAVCQKKFNRRWLRAGIFCAMFIAISVTGAMLTKNRGTETSSAPVVQPNSATSVSAKKDTPSLDTADRVDSAIPFGVGLLAVLIGFRVIPLGKRSDGSPRVTDQIAKSAKWTGLASILLGFFGIVCQLIKAARLSHG